MLFCNLLRFILHLADYLPVFSSPGQAAHDHSAIFKASGIDTALIFINDINCFLRTNGTQQTPHKKSHLY